MQSFPNAPSEVDEVSVVQAAALPIADGRSGGPRALAGALQERKSAELLLRRSRINPP